MDDYAKARDLFNACMDMYHAGHCPCYYPRYHQLAGIDCVATGDSFKCYDTELLIEISKPYFTIENLNPGGGSANERWTCRKCGSVYHYNWSDFSIYVERQTLQLSDLKVKPTGKPALKPIPLFLGLSGHSYPPQTEMIPADFEAFKSYMMEE